MKKVCIGVAMGENVSGNFFASFVGLEKKGDDFEANDITTSYCLKTDIALEALTEEFLKTDNEWMLFLETDMTHPKDTIAKLIRHNLPVVSGVQTWKTKPFVPMVYRYRPMVLWGQGKDTQWKTGPYQAIDDWKDGDLLQVDGVPCGCLLVRRDVFEKIQRPWFSFEGGTQDLYFCKKVLAAGFTIHCDTSVDCGHFTTIKITMAEHRRYMKAHPEELEQ